MGCTIESCLSCGFLNGEPVKRICVEHRGKFGKCKNELGEFEKADAFFYECDIPLCRKCANAIRERIIEAYFEKRGL